MLQTLLNLLSQLIAFSSLRRCAEQSFCQLSIILSLFKGGNYISQNIFTCIVPGWNLSMRGACSRFRRQKRRRPLFSSQKDAWADESSKLLLDKFLKELLHLCYETAGVDGLTLKLMKFKLQGSFLAWTLSRTLGLLSS